MRHGGQDPPLEVLLNIGFAQAKYGSMTLINVCEVTKTRNLSDIMCDWIFRVLVT